MDVNSNLSFKQKTKRFLDILCPFIVFWHQKNTFDSISNNINEILPLKVMLPTPAKYFMMTTHALRQFQSQSSRLGIWGLSLVLGGSGLVTKLGKFAHSCNKGKLREGHVNDNDAHSSDKVLSRT